MVFADGAGQQLAEMAGTVEAGYTATLGDSGVTRFWAGSVPPVDTIPAQMPGLARFPPRCGIPINRGSATAVTWCLYAGDPARADRQPVQAPRVVPPSAEIYGGFPQHEYDYGPLGALMLRNVKEAWIRAMVQEQDDVVLIDAATLGPPQVWEASGHLANFHDPLVDCTNCKQRFRQDKLDDPDTCPNCGAHGSFTEARRFGT